MEINKEVSLKGRYLFVCVCVCACVCVCVWVCLCVCVCGRCDCVCTGSWSTAVPPHSGSVKQHSLCLVTRSHRVDPAWKLESYKCVCLCVRVVFLKVHLCEV